MTRCAAGRVEQGFRVACPANGRVPFSPSPICTPAIFGTCCAPQPMADPAGPAAPERQLLDPRALPRKGSNTSERFAGPSSFFFTLGYRLSGRPSIHPPSPSGEVRRSSTP